MALVLSGGGGERMSVLTTERAVSAVPFGGKYRIIDFALSNCCHSEMPRVGVITQHAPTSLHDHIGAGRPWDLDRRSGGVLIMQPYLTRSHGGWYRGTADAIAQNWDVLEEHRPDRVLVLSGDHVYRMDYRALTRAHDERRATLTVAVTRVARDQARRFGMVKLDRDGRMLNLVEKPEHANTPFASMGIYLFEFSALRDAVRGHPVDMVKDVVRAMLESGERVYTHEFTGYWEDVGTVDSFYRANLELVAPEPRLALYDTRWPILTRDQERSPALILDGAVVEDSLVANGCRISGTVRRSVLFSGVKVEAGAEVVDSVIMADTVIGRGAHVDRAILDKYVHVGENAAVGHGEAPHDDACAWLSGIALVGKDAVIPDGMRVGRASVVGIGSGPEDFATAELAAGTLMPSRSWFKVDVG
jgi:glucose-1-phosphate adenylyltransferase